MKGNPDFQAGTARHVDKKSRLFFGKLPTKMSAGGCANYFHSSYSSGNLVRRSLQENSNSNDT